MKNFKIYLVETLIQLTILVSISRYNRHSTNSDSDPYQELLQKSLIDFERNNYLQQQHHHHNNYHQSSNYFKQDFNFEQYLEQLQFPATSKDFLNFDKNNNYLEDIIRHNTREGGEGRQQQLNIYLNPSYNYLRVTDKFFEHPELQTKNSLISFCNNANISPEDMSVIKRILFEQDIDVGVDRSYYDPEYRTNSFEKNYTNNNKDELDLLLQNNHPKPTFVFKSPKVATDEELLLIPDGYQKVVEEDTGEVFFIPTEQPVKIEIPIEPVIIEPKLLPTSDSNTFNPVTLERYSSNKGTFDELNDNFFDDLSFLNTPPTDVKFDEAWLKNFMEPTADAQQEIPQQQQQTNNTSADVDRITDFLSAFTPNNSLDLIEKKDDLMFPTVDLNLTPPQDGIISVVNNDELTYLNSMGIDLLIENNNGNNVTQFEQLINNNDLYNLGEFDFNEVNIDFDENLSSSSTASTSSSIVSDSSYNNYNNNNTLLENQIVIKQEATIQDAMYGFMHNHTYLESKVDDVYHPHSYKNKLKNMMNATSRESRDEALLLEFHIDYSLDTIVNSNVDAFTELLKDPKLTAEQLNIMRDIRRRGKNKIAAKTCRKRKIDSIDNLKEDVDELRNKKKMLELEREKIQEQMKQFAAKIDGIYKDLTGSNQDPSDPIKNYIENLLKQLNERTGDQVSTASTSKSKSSSSSDKTPRNNKRK